LENSFGAGEVVVTRSDYVGSRFSKQLTDQAGGLLFMTLLLILAYCSFFGVHLFKNIVAACFCFIKLR
jgi:preprotein translocase subunit SecF